MMGVGFDWVNDWYAADYYEHSPEKNPQGPEQGEEKITRGADGSFYLKNLTMNRYPTPLKNRNIPGLGFRCAVQSPTPVQSVAK